ncbi:TonB-dependent receptor [Sphingomonas cavernae]|nr:TonB-dependent receptor [Sphingomonas cavernae]
MKYRSLRFAAMLFAGCAAPALAQADSAIRTAGANEASPVDTGEIIVTARKREERLQDVPLSISVVGSDTIDRANLENISDLAMQTPGFSFKQGFGRIGGGGGAGVRPSIRGMSSVVGAPNAAFFVDGVFVSDNISSYHLDNLERVEVIKGPQSALFGRQTFSGAINYVTRRPTNDFSGKAKLTLAEYDNLEASGYLSGPIVTDVLLFEMNARYSTFGGDYVNGDTGKRDLGAQKSTNVGGRLLFTPSTNFEAIASIGFSQDRDKGYVYGFQGSAKNNCFAPPIVGTMPFPRTNTSRRGFYCGEVEILPSYAYNNDAIEAAGFDGLNREFLRTSLAMTYTTDSGFSLTSISAYNTNDSITGQDNTLLPSANPAFTVDRSKSEDFSQEIRLMTPQDKPLRGLIGAYYYREDVEPGFTYTNTSPTRRPFDSEDGVRSKSVFGMIEGAVTDQVTLSAEARYQSETIKGSTEVLGTAGNPPPATTGIRRAKFDAFLPRFTARYEPSSDVSFYVSAAKGNKPGGFNNFPTDAIPADIAAFTAAGFDVFDEETAWSYEIGSKGRIGGVVDAAVAAFYIDWTKQQLSRGEAYTRLNGTPNSVAFIQNAGASEIKGFEVELSGKPADWLYLRLGYTYVNAEFTDFYDDTTEEIFDTDGRPARLPNGQRNPADVDGLAGGDVSGNKLPQTPEHQIIATAQVTAPLSGALEFFGRGDFAYESKRYAQVDNLNHTGDSYNVNLSIGIERPEWSVSLFARNLLNDQTPLVVTRLLDFNRLLTRVNPLTGRNQTTFFRDFAVSAPRKQQFGINLQYRF